MQAGPTRASAAGKQKGVAGACAGGELTARQLELSPGWTDRGQDAGLGTNVTAHGLGLSSGQSGERGRQRIRRGGDHRLPPHEAARGTL